MRVRHPNRYVVTNHAVYDNSVKPHSVTVHSRLPILHYLKAPCYVWYSKEYGTMTRKRSIALALPLAGMVSLGGMYGVNAAGRASATSAPTQYIGTMLAPQGTSQVMGAVAMIAEGGNTTVAINLMGLQPSTRYAVQVRQGACGSSGSIGNGSTTTGSVIPSALATGLSVKGDAMGEARLVGAVMVARIPTSGASIVVVQGNATSATGATGGTGTTGSGTAQQSALACGNVVLPKAVTLVRPMSSAGSVGGTGSTGSSGRMRSTNSAVAMIVEPAPVAGAAIKTGTQVLVYGTGLQPLTAQPLHIHAGPCSNPTAPIKYPLNDLVSDARGRALSGTGLTDMVPLSGLSIHIHATSWPMTACGSIGGM